MACPELHESRSFPSAGNEETTTVSLSEAVHAAARLGHVTRLRHLLEVAPLTSSSCEDVIERRRGTPTQRTPLLAAFARGHYACAQVLLQAGARADVRDANGRSALHLVAARGDTRSVRLLLGIPAVRDQLRCPIQCLDAYGRSPITHAITNAQDDVEGDIDQCVRLLLLAAPHLSICGVCNPVRLAAAAGRWRSLLALLLSPEGLQRPGLSSSSVRTVRRARRLAERGDIPLEDLVLLLGPEDGVKVAQEILDDEENSPLVSGHFISHRRRWSSEGCRSTVLHLAASASSVRCVRLLLSVYVHFHGVHLSALPDPRDEGSLKSQEDTFRGSPVVRLCCREALKARDAAGRTPLQALIATGAERVAMEAVEMAACAVELLRHGASATATIPGNNRCALEALLNEVPVVEEALAAELDACVHSHFDGLGQRMILVNFR